MKMFFDNVNALFPYNESVMIISLTYNVKFTLNIKSAVLNICYSMTPICVT